MDRRLEKLERKIFSYMKQKANSFEGKPSKELLSYRQNESLFFKRPTHLTTTKILIRSILQANFIFLGDFHTFAQNSKNLRRILKPILGKKRKISIALEFIRIEHQGILDKYLKGEINEKRFLQRIDYQSSWRFPWKHYKEILDLAKKNGIQVIALNSIGTLSQRDITAASVLSEHYHQYRPDKMLILFGELHIMPNKLPLRLKNRVPHDTKSLILHQNSDTLFWRHYPQTRKSSVVSFNSQEFSLQTSPPWVKYESMIYWYETSEDDPLFDYNDHELGRGFELSNDSTDEYFKEILISLAKTLQLSIPETSLIDFSLYDFSKRKQVLKKIALIKNPPFRNFLEKLLISGKNFQLPHERGYYCSNYTLTRLSFIAGLHLHTIALYDASPNFSPLKGDAQNRFLYFYYAHTYSYLSSKIINPSRKCALYHDLVHKRLSPDSSEKKRLIASIALMTLENPEDLAIQLVSLHLKEIYSLAKMLGYITGELLYSYIEKGGIKHQLKLKTFLTIDQNLEATLSKLTALLSEVEFKKLKKRLL